MGSKHDKITVLLNKYYYKCYKQAYLLQQDIHLKYSEQINICLHLKLSTMNRGLLKRIRNKFKNKH